MKPNLSRLLLFFSSLLVGCRAPVIPSSSDSDSSKDSSDSKTSSSDSNTSSSIESSESESSSYSTVEVGDSFTLDSHDKVNFMAGKLEKEGVTFAVKGASSLEGGLCTLARGGTISNLSPFSKNLKSITISYECEETYSCLLTKASPYIVTSPSNGAYEIENEVPFSFAHTGSYFSVHSPLTSYSIKSISLAFSNYSGAVPQDDYIDFYTINDTHGAADFDYEPANRKYQSGIRKLSSFLLKKEREKPENTIALSSGDMWEGGSQSTLLRGRNMIDWMNIAGFEAMAIGNHEFSWTPSVIASNAELANFPFLGLNIRDESKKLPSWSLPSKVISRGQYKIGVVGAIGDIQRSISKKALAGYTLDCGSLAKDVENEASRLRKEEKCDLVVLSIHYSKGKNSNETMPFPGVDAIFEGHTHLSYGFLDTLGVPHLQTYGDGGNIQNVRFKYSKSEKKFVYYSMENITIDTITSLPDDPLTSRMEDYYDAKLSSVLDENFGSSSVMISKDKILSFAASKLYSYYSVGHTLETPLVGAVLNTGAVRQTISSGPITMRKVISALPFENENVECELKVKYLRRMAASPYYSSHIESLASFQDNDKVRIITLSYISDGDYADNYGLKEIKRDDYFLRNIVGDYLRGGASFE